MTEWIFDNTIVNDAPEGVYGFVYLITRLDTGRMYVGRKFITMSSGKGKPRKASKWQSYWGSCKPLLAEIREQGKELYRREILKWCYSRGETTYQETLEQFRRDVLNAKLADGTRAYYNGNIMARWFAKKSEQDVKHYLVKCVQEL